MDLHQNSYEPFRKPSNTPLYINTESNHPPHTKKNIPIAVNKRLNMLSSSKKLFYSHKEEYQLALKKSGYNYEINYTNSETKQKTSVTTERSKTTANNNTAAQSYPRNPTSPDPRPTNTYQLTNSPQSPPHTSPAPKQSPRLPIH